MSVEDHFGLTKADDQKEGPKEQIAADKTKAGVNAASHFDLLTDKNSVGNEAVENNTQADQDPARDPYFGRSEAIIEEDELRQAEVDKQKRHPGYDGTSSHSGYYPEAQADNLAKEAAGKDPHLDFRAADIVEFGVSGENKTLWEKMSGAGKAIFDGLLKVSGINNLTAKLGMKYEQFWLEKANEKTERLGRQAQILDARIKLKEKIIADMESKEENNFIKKEIKKLKLQSRKDEVAKLEDEKNKLMAKIGIHEADARLFAQKRDEVADWLIGYYDEKLAKPAAELEVAKAALNNFDTENEPVEKEFAEMEAEIVGLEKQRDEEVKLLAASGMEAKKINKEVSYFDKEMKGLRAELQGRRGVLRERRGRLEQKIAKANEKFVRVDKRPEFINAKNSKALILTPPTPEVSGSEVNADPVAAPSPAAQESSSSENVEKRMYPMKDISEAWNEFIKEKINQGFKFHVDESIGLEVLAQNMQGGEQVDIGGFEQITRTFYAAKYPRATFLKQTIFRFLDEFVKNSDFLMEAYGGRNNSTKTDFVPNPATQSKKDSVQESAEIEEEVDEEQPESGEEMEVSGENQESKVEEFAEQWKEFVIKNFGLKRSKGLIIEPNELKGAEGVPGDELIDIRKFVAIIEQFYQKNFKIGKKAKIELDQVIANFLKDGGRPTA